MVDNQRQENQGFIKEYGIPFLLCILIASSLMLARVPDWPYTDPRGSLLSGQVFLETGSFILDEEGQYLPGYYWQLMRNGEDVFYSYPLGTTLLHLPAIWVANQFGWDLMNVDTEASLNRILAALSVAILFMQVFRLARRWNNYTLSLLMALLLVMGTGVYSTLGLALWNLNYFVIISLWLYAILLKSRPSDNPDLGWLLGILLFAGFIIRPSFALCIIAVFAYLLFHNYRQLMRAASVSVILLSLYILFSKNTFGLTIPGSYNVSDFSKWNEVIVNLAGHLISPSRGILVFSPFLLITIGGLIWHRKPWKMYPFLKYMIAILLCQWLLLSLWFMWWGGGGFGNRLSLEFWPVLIILTLLFAGPFLSDSTGKLRQASQLVLFITGVFSVWIHVSQGANNRETVNWFQHPNKDEYPQYFWNLRFPQFLASQKQLLRMDDWHWDNVVKDTLVLSAHYDVDDDNLEFANWYDVENDGEKFRWSKGKYTLIKLPAPKQMADGNRVIIVLNGRTYKDQEIGASVSGQYAGSIETNEKTGRFNFRLHPVEMKGVDVLELHIHITEPKAPAVVEPEVSMDPRLLGMSLYNISVYVEKDSPAAYSVQ